MLHLGEPEFCQGKLRSNYTFDVNSSPKINIIICGVPQPDVQGDFNDNKFTASGARVNSFTHNFTLQLPRLTQTVCGKELMVTATGYNASITDKTKIFVRNCKYDYCVYLIFVLSQKNVFWKVFVPQKYRLVIFY